MKINKDTQICISISERPGNMGSTIHNALYERHGLNFIYKSFGVSRTNFASVIMGIRALGIRGCSVSMPFKELALSYLDKVDDAARSAVSVNTILNVDSKLTGYNTDISGAFRAISELVNDDVPESVLMLGAGATARSVSVALKKLGVKQIYIWNRSRNSAHFASFINNLGIKSQVVKEDDDCVADLLVNCTPNGMSAEDELLVPQETIKKFKYVFDVVVNSTELVQTAISSGIKATNGLGMALHQALRQFEIYTGMSLDIAAELDFVRNLV